MKKFVIGGGVVLILAGLHLIMWLHSGNSPSGNDGQSQGNSIGIIHVSSGHTPDRVKVDVPEMVSLPQAGLPKAENKVVKFDTSFVGEWVKNPESKVNMVPSTIILQENGTMKGLHGGFGWWEFDGENIIITAGPRTDWWKVGNNKREMTLTHRSLRGGPKEKFERYASRLLKEAGEDTSGQPPSTGEGEGL